jgi:hypothetical protein
MNNLPSIQWLPYSVTQSYLHHWLVAGPAAVPVTDLADNGGGETKLRIARAYTRTIAEVLEQPAERGQFVHQGQTLTWQAVTCGDDHFVDLTCFYHTCHFLSAWAYTQVEVDEAHMAAFVLTTNGPADVWINNQHVLGHQHFSHQLPQRTPFSAWLTSGRNTILVRFGAVAIRECPYVMALQLVPDPKYSGRATAIYLPTTIQSVARRQWLEALFQAAYLQRDVYHRDMELIIHWPTEMKLSGEITVRLQTPAGRIYAEAKPYVRGGETVNLGRVYAFPDGAYQVVLMPPLEEYYEHGLRLQHRLNLQIANQPHASTPVTHYAERRLEALDDAARRGVNVYSEIAKMALGRWAQLKLPLFEQAIARINQRADCSDFYLVGLLGMLHRYGADPHFPPALTTLVNECAINFKYWMDESGHDAMCYWSENHQILFHACQVLAGQLFPETLFTNNGQTGRWHQARGEERALSWLRKRAAGGFREWDSNTYFEHDVLALTHLADLASNVEVAEMAAVVLDKLFFSMAINSFKGVFGSTHGRAYAAQIKGGRLELTSGIGRLLWGMGALNQHILGTVSLACATGYELPPIIAQIATDLPQEMWSRECHAGQMEEWCDRATGAWRIHKATFKTPDYMLCSALDYRPGQPGYQQHIWQATFDADAVLFVNHPVCLSEENAHRPGCWHGNGVLPRIGQWKDVLVALYQLPADDWLGFTHAYFPTAAFDEYLLDDGWLFARKGEGLLALTAAQGLELVTHGPTAYREIRSHGRQNAWFLHLGRVSKDGRFAEFQDKMPRSEVSFDGQWVHAHTLYGATIDFGWEGPLLVDEQPYAQAGMLHYDNPYCAMELNAPEMELRWQDELLRLRFA